MCIRDRYQNRVAIEGDLGEADVAELESMAPVQDKEDKQWAVRAHVHRREMMYRISTELWNTPSIILVPRSPTNVPSRPAKCECLGPKFNAATVLCGACLHAKHSWA